MKFKNKPSTNEDNSNAKGIAFEINNIKCSKEEEIEVAINLDNETDFVAANFEMPYDGKNMEYVNYKIGNSLENGAMTLVNNNESENKVYIGFVAKPGEETVIPKGNLVTLKFRIKENAENKKINTEFNCTTLKQKNGEDVLFNIRQGVIEIK